MTSAQEYYLELDDIIVHFKRIYREHTIENFYKYLDIRIKELKDHLRTYENIRWLRHQLNTELKSDELDAVQK